MSKFHDRRAAFRERTEQGVKDREKTGGRFSCVSLAKVEGVVFFKPTADKKHRNEIDIIPFLATQDWISKMRSFNGAILGVNPGDMLYKLEVPGHPRVGSEERTFLCLKAAFGKSCPICNEREALKENEDADEDLIKSLYPKWRVFYNLRDKNEEDKEKRRKIWDCPYHSFEKFFLEEADMGEDGVVIFADPEEGKTIRFKGREKNFSGRKYLEADSIEFLDRKKQYDEDDIKESISFDKYLRIPTYEEVEKAYLGLDNDEKKSDKKRKEEKEEENE